MAEKKRIVKLMKNLGLAFTEPPGDFTEEDQVTKTLRLNELPDPAGRDIYLHINKEANETYDRICSLLAEEKTAEHLSRREIERAIIRFIREIIIDQKRFKDLKVLNSQVEQALSALLKPFEPWWVIAPVEGLQIDFNEINLGDHFIRKFQAVDIHSYFPNSDSDFQKSIQKNFLNKFCIFVTVESNNHKSAEDKGEEKINEILNILRSFFGTHFFARFAIPHMFASINRISKKGYLSQEFEHKELCHIESRFQQSLSSYLELIRPFVSSNTNTAIVRKIISAFRWLGMAVQDELPQDKIVKCCTALETLLIPETEGLKGELLAFRTALLEYRLAQSDYGTHPNRILQYYKKRSQIIHGDNEESNMLIEKLALEIEHFTYTTLRSVLRAIRENNNIQSVRQLTEWIEQPDQRTTDMEDHFLREDYDRSLQRFVNRRRNPDNPS